LEYRHDKGYAGLHARGIANQSLGYPGQQRNRHDHGDGHGRIHRERNVCRNWLPSGVTASFSPASSTTGSSVLTLTASSTATLGSRHGHHYRNLGNHPATTTIALTVSPFGRRGCTVDYTISPQNTSAFGASITIVNGPTAITSWTLTWTFANGQTVAELWNGIETQSGANVTVKNEPYNGSIAAGGTLSGIGFNGTWNGTTNAVPTAISLNGTACTVN
jgi:hypothetical protein